MRELELFIFFHPKYFLRAKTNDDFCALSGMEIYILAYIRIWDLSVNSSGFLNGPLVQKIRYFKAGSGSGSKDLDLLNPSGCTYVIYVV